jgi:hypothetical protein
VLAQRTPPIRAAAKRRSQAELGCGLGPRGGVYGALTGRLTAKRRGMLSAGSRGMMIMDGKKDLMTRKSGNFTRELKKETGLLAIGKRCEAEIGDKR